MVIGAGCYATRRPTTIKKHETHTYLDVGA